MKIVLKANGCSNRIIEFDSKEELYDFVKFHSELEITEFSNEEDEKLKWKILNSKNCDNITIYELIELIDYQRVYDEKPY